MVVVMTPFVFDTLSASKQLREAGMDEGVAEAVVSVFQHAAATPDISHLATKADIADMATKSELNLLRAEMRTEFASLRAEFNDKLRQQGWMLLGGVAVLLTISTAMTRVLAG
jgi:hypothetical protein